MSHQPQSEADTSVLVVGGGVAGLSAALCLAWRGVRTVLVEKHPGSSPHPRAIGFTTRTLELFRAVGLGSSIPQIPVGHGRPRRVAVESLAGKWSEEVFWTPQTRVPQPGDAPPSEDGYSPCTGAAIAQDRLEPILRARAIELGADIRMSTRMDSFEQSSTGVVTVLRSGDSAPETLRSDYMIAADGHRSRIREALGIARTGHGPMHIVRSVLFRADLEQYLERGISQFELDQPGLKGMLTTYRDGRWLLMFMDDQERDRDTLREMVVRAIGRADLDVEIITTGRWELSALIADRFSLGRTFLAGDAAHTLPPARGGYGANTGIEDSFNLAWKLSAVISGAATADLLDTYDAERRPIAWLRHDQIFARQDYAKVATDAEKKVAIIEDEAMELGQLYRSASILGAGPDLPAARRPEQWAGHPGSRAPHLWVTSAGKRLSTLDFFHQSWVLVTEEAGWCAVVAEVAAQLKVELRCLYFGCGAITDANRGDLEAGLLRVECDATAADPVGFRSRFGEAFGVDATGASLVRPDGYVAWRTLSLPPQPAEVLRIALGDVAFAKSLRA